LNRCFKSNSQEASVKMKGIIYIVSAILVLLGSGVSSGEAVLVEAEGFSELGGWVIDQQFMDQMGSPFLLAHGLGEPVEDARTIVEFPQTGRYRVWVRTRDWVGSWKASGAPGKFQVLIDGKPLKKVFGTEGAEWHWQDGGRIKIDKSKVEIALRDLTGFEGRCDAIVFSSDGDFVPPNEGEKMREFRRKALGLPDKPIDGGTYDLVVIGGGMAGTCSAITAARLGLSVALIQDRPVFGGNNSSEVRVGLEGETNYEPYPKIGSIVQELDPHTRVCPGSAAAYGDDKKLAIMVAEKNIRLFLNMHVFVVEKKGDKITGVLAKDIRDSREVRFSGALFADCTGDGTVGFLAGAEFDMTLKGHLGGSNLWRVVNTSKPSSFPRCPWALDLRDKPFPGRRDNRGAYDERGLSWLGGWFWESGFFYDPIEKGEYIRDLNFRAMYGAWDCLKNVDKVYPNHKIEWAAYISGKRESRRLLGDVVLTKDDLMSGKVYADGCVPTSWDIDLHLPAPQYVDEHGDDAFISKDYHTDYKRPYWIPYRCLYSRNISNLFMAGRDISVTSEALGTVRVMRTTGMMGEVVGMAASLCKKHDTTPRGVYENYLEELKGLMKGGVGKRTLEEQGQVLLDFEGDFDVGKVETSNGAKVEISKTAEGSSLKITGDKGDKNATIKLSGPAGGWDISKYLYLTMDVRNVGGTEGILRCRIESKGWVDGGVILKGGASDELQVVIRRHIKDIPSYVSKELFGMKALPGGYVWACDDTYIDYSKVSELEFSIIDATGRCVFEVDNIRAGGKYELPTEEQLKTTFFPFIDRYGQYIHKDWPGKCHSDEELKSQIVKEEAELTKYVGPDDWDKYGGWAAGPKLEATGHFRVEKYKDKWWFVDPEGRLFWSIGPDCVRFEVSTPITDREQYFAELPAKDSAFGKFYGESRWAPQWHYKNYSVYRTYDFGGSNLFRKYGEDWRERASDISHRRLRSWGMNTMANWSEPEIYLQRKTPYFVSLSTGGKAIEASEGTWRKFPDPFDESFRRTLEESFEKEKGKTAEDGWCIGYFIDNELSWGDEVFLAKMSLTSPAEQAAKRVFIEELKAKYETIDKLNAVWGSDYKSWEGMLEAKETPDVEKARDDLAAFNKKIAERYFGTCRDVLKEAAPRKLYLGCRFDFHYWPKESHKSDWPLAIAAKHCDVVSFNRYCYSGRALRPPVGFDKPLIIGEFHFGALDRGLFNPTLRCVANQRQRGAAYTAYVRSCLENPYLVGAHWFQYCDQAATGRGDGENYQVGLVDICDTPYPETIAACREAGYGMYEYRMKN